jgi:hypothetical protein
LTLPPDKSPWRWLLWPFSIILAIILLIDDLVRPIYRPILNWIARRRFMERFRDAIEPLPRFTILILFGVPFAIAEPLKVFALYLVARGLVVTGIVLLIFAYLMTFLIVERIYEAGHGKLLTYPWFAWAMKQIKQVRDVIVAAKNIMVARARAWFVR